MSDFLINLAEDFHPEPYGRYRADGDGNAESFREEHLIPAIREHDHVVVDLGGYNYYGSSFLEEVFGGLVRAGFSRKFLSEKLKIIHGRLPSIEDEAQEYIDMADAKISREIELC